MTFDTDLDILLIEYGHEVPHEAVVGEQLSVLAVDVHLQVLFGAVHQGPEDLQDELVLGPLLAGAAALAAVALVVLALLVLVVSWGCSGIFLMVYLY